MQEIQEQPVKFLSAYYPLQPESINAYDLEHVLKKATRKSALRGRVIGSLVVSTKGSIRSKCCQSPGLLDVEDKLIHLVFKAANIQTF